MITTKIVAPNIYRVTQTVTHRYWDLTRKLISESEHFPDNLLTKTMSDEDEARFNDHYRRKVCTE